MFIYVYLCCTFQTNQNVFEKSETEYQENKISGLKKENKNNKVKCLLKGKQQKNINDYKQYDKDKREQVL